MAYSQNLAKLGFVKGVGAAPRSAPRGNLTTDPYYTDGLRRVMVFERAPTSLARSNSSRGKGPLARLIGQGERAKADR